MYVISSCMEYMASLQKLLVCYYVVIFFNTEENLKKKNFFPLLFEMISHAFHGSWQHSKTFLINLTLEVVRIDFLPQNFYDSIHLISVIHKSFYCFLFVLFPLFLASCFFLRSVEFSPVFKALLKQLYNSIFRKIESAESF